MILSAAAEACANIAFIKYWGNRDASLRLPQSGSISMNLAGLTSTTRVAFRESQTADTLELNGKAVIGPGLARVSGLLNLVREAAHISLCADVASTNNFPTGAGMASSASAFAALALAASRAAGLELTERDLSRLARRGSGSACRSIPDGFAEWLPGSGDADSYAVSIAPAGHWDLVDLIAVVDTSHKPTGSSEGHALADTSPLQGARVADAPRRLQICREAVLKRDFDQLAQVAELDSNLMHAVMMTSQPALLYWQPGTLAVMQAVTALRKKGLPACYTIDAGANVHVIAERGAAEAVKAGLIQTGASQVIQSKPGGPARLLDAD
ncbi:MAG TPA: diphosphomevalonate decarboxylase [Anaerolineales bacterium]